jgi:lincosamide nucleotidyltransferase B/F
MSALLPQASLVEKLRDVCQQDKRVLAALLYGSLATGEADAYSDIECAMYFESGAFPTINKREWVEQVSPVLLFFADQFGHYTAIFDNLIRGEFHFEPVEKIEHISTWKGNAWFPAADAAILVDRTGVLLTTLQPLIGPPPEHDTPETAENLAANFVNLILFGINTLERGEFARSLELLSLLQRSLIWMARLIEGTTAHWPTPSRGLERDLSSTAYQRLVDCSASLHRKDLYRAYQATWKWGTELMALLGKRRPLAVPQQLLDLLSRKIEDITGKS